MIETQFSSIEDRYSSCIDDEVEEVSKEYEFFWFPFRSIENRVLLNCWRNFLIPLLKEMSILHVFCIRNAASVFQNETALASIDAIEIVFSIGKDIL